MTTVIIDTDSAAGKKLLDQVKQHPHVAKIIEEEEGDSKKRYSYQEFKEKFASSLNKRFNADIKV